MREERERDEGMDDEATNSDSDASDLSRRAAHDPSNYTDLQFKAVIY